MRSINGVVLFMEFFSKRTEFPFKLSKFVVFFSFFFLFFVAVKVLLW